MALALWSLDDEDGVVVVDVAAVELACLGVVTSLVTASFYLIFCWIWRFEDLQYVFRFVVWCEGM